MLRGLGKAIPLLGSNIWGIDMICRLSFYGTILLFLLGITTYGASIATMPVSEDFASGELPHDTLTKPPYYFPIPTPWSVSTNGAGRTEIAYDETDPETQLVPLTMPSASVTIGSNRQRGNYYSCTNSGVLVSQGFYLSRTQDVNVTFFVYESATSNGTYTLLSSNTVNTASGDGIVTSDEVNISMNSGTYYLLGAGWDASATYQYKGSYHPNAMPLGATIGGFLVNVATPSVSLTGNPTTTAYQQEVTISDNAVVRMDSTAPTAWSTNSMDLAVNMAGYSDVKLAFRYRDSGDEAHPSDGIFLSDDGGSSFTRINSLPATTAWDSLVLDIDALAGVNGLALTNGMVVRFQQADNYPWGTDGREFDDIKLYSKPDLAVTSVKAASSFTWKGFTSDKSLLVSLAWYGRGGISKSSSLAVDFEFGLREVSDGSKLYSETDTQPVVITEMTSTHNSESHTLAVPSGLHLSNLYYTVYAIADADNDVSEAIETNNEETDLIEVNHYSGLLWFNDIETEIDVSSWGTRVTDSAYEHWITGTGTLNSEAFSFTDLHVVKDLSTLDYALTVTNTTIINVPYPERYVVSNVTYWRVGGVDLSVDGAYSDIKVLLPAGLGISTNSLKFMESTFVFADRKLNQELYPDGSVSESAAFHLSEESKPLVYNVSSMTWDPESALFSFTKNGVTFVRADEYAYLDAERGALVDKYMSTKKSNAAYYRGVNALLDDPYVNVGAKGEALLSTKLELGNVDMSAHFPFGLKLAWGSGSQLLISDDLIDGYNSTLNNMTNTSISYIRDCTGPECAGDAGDATVAVASDGNYSYLSMDGGIRTPVNVLSSGNLQWGTRFDLEFTHQTTNFTAGVLYMPGHFIRGDISDFDVSENRGPAEILLSGMQTNSFTEMERPDTSGYQNGFADYAGLNFRVGGDRALDGTSIVGGTNTGWWGLTGRSKYYVRASGVSGIHEAADNEFPEELEIYGYQFTFSNYGLSFLSGLAEESRINGSVAVPEPCDIEMTFEELMLCCLGELEEAQLVDTGSKTLTYWDAVVNPLTMFFAPTDSSSCEDSARKLCLGLTTQCANVDQTLSGVLGFMPDGDLGSPADKIEGVQSRLSIPNQIELDGPGDEIYYFNPVAMAYYNDYAKSLDSMSEKGWINFAGNLDIAFFNDLPVQFHTSASTNSEVANIYMTGGWGETQTFFNSDPDEFDTENSGYPVGEASYTEYRNPDSDEYRTHAQRSWLGVVEFDYPLEWSYASKSFKSPEAVTVDLLVLNIEHQADYLSAENAEISFGLQYDGLPQINIANMAFNALDDSTGMMSAFQDKLGDAVHEAIESGASAMEDTLSDLPEDLFEPVFEKVLDPMVDQFYADLSAAYADAPDGDYYSSVITQYVYGVDGDAYTNVEYVLKNLTDGVNMATNLLGEIDSNLDQVVKLIDAFVSVVPGTNSSGVAEDLPGVLFQTSGEYSTMANLGIGLLSVLSEALYDALQDELNDEIKSAMESAQPSLDAITEVLTELRVVVINVQSQLDSAGSIATELSDTLNSSELDDAISKINSGIEGMLASLSDGNIKFDEYSAAEMKGMIRQKITDAFYGSVPCADVQQVIRSRLYDVDAAIQEAIDSAFQQLNKAIRDLVSEYMSGIDDELNDMLGDISDVMGSGEIDGYAHIRGDSLTELRVDGKFLWQVPDEMEFNAYLIVRQLDSSSAGGCGVEGEVLPEVTLGTEGFGISWLGSDIKADISTKFTFMLDGSSTKLIGMAGAFEMVEGKFDFEAFAITELYAGVAFGLLENYLSANLRCEFGSYEVEGGVFFGKACSLDPFSWDPDVQAVLGDPPFTGVYVYGEGWMPIYDYGCLFRIKAGVGAGVFAFVDGPVGGKIFLGADGEALCAVNVAGEVTLVGLKDGDDMRMTGKGTISGRAGSCPFCVKFSKTVTIGYDNGSWDADY